MSDRGQLSLSVVEAAVGIVFVFAVTTGFAFGVAAPETTAHLDAEAEGALTILASEPPAEEQSRLATLAESKAAFDAERDALTARVESILGEGLLFRLETPHGTLGHRPSADAATGEATTVTAGGQITIRVWYA
ncbi:MAG: hypothetical protein PPP58_12570 [Natronomonas sp.]